MQAEQPGQAAHAAQAGQPSTSGSGGLGIKKSAGKHLAQLVDGSDKEVILSVLNLLVKPLTSKVWEVRMAAAFAVECILGKTNFEAIEMDPAEDPVEFDLESILSHCPELVASGGTEYDIDVSLLSRKDFLKLQKQNVTKSLGIGEGMGMEEFASQLVTDEDLKVEVKPQVVETQKKELSARERAMLKRHNRIQNRRQSLPETKEEEPHGFGLLPFSDLQSHWLAELVTCLQNLMVHPNWFVRHGAFVGLQACSPFISGTDQLEDLIHRTLCVLALDRFGDFNGDQMVAPVREAAAQLLAMLFKQSGSKDITLLLQLGNHPSVWQIRHSGLLALKYICPLLLETHKKEIYDLSFNRLGDADDDVKATAAQILSQVGNYPDQLLQTVIDILELDVDESSTLLVPLFDLLHKCVLHSDLIDTDRISKLILPFLTIPNVSVRCRAFELLNSLDAKGEDIFRLAWQNLLLEEDQSVLVQSQKLASNGATHLNGLVDILLTPLESPFDPRHFCFYRLGCGKSNSPAPYEVGFRKADLMLLGEDQRLLGRRRAAKVLSGVVLPDDEISSLRVFVAAWLKIPIKLDGITEGRAAIAYWASQGTHKTELLEALLSEPLLELQEDIAAGLVGQVSIDDITRMPFDGHLAERGVTTLVKQADMKWSDVAESVPIEQRFKLATIFASLGDDLMSIWSFVSPTITHPLALRVVEALVANQFNLETLISFLLEGVDDDEKKRLASATILHRLVVDHQERLLPFAALLTVPVLAWMSDQNPSIRQEAAATFAELVKVVSLKAEITLVDPHLIELHGLAQTFLSRLIDGQEKVEPYALPVPVNATLRHYQEDGVAWMMFLRAAGLHGVLSDDMGLGKTLQTLCVLASDQYERKTKKPSLVICPGSLVGHWAHEATQYCPTLRKVLLYAGKASERQHIADGISESDLVVCSYETARNDCNILSSTVWSYVVLDEGHVIRNAKTKTAQAIKSFRADHRLILSGTPIQNNVLELWALFDFLMPGFLGSEADFLSRFAKPILAVQPNMGSSSNSTTAADFDEAEKKLAALHKQVLPFMLRRMKSDVLQDLPPKIIQDYECEPSAVQKLLLDDFARKSDLVKDLEQTDPSDKMHIFQALQYLRKLCVHPAMVLSQEHPLRDTVLRMCDGKDIHDIAFAPKLTMLKELLTECGIGNEEDEAGHRVLIFAQQKTTLDLVASQVLSHHIPFLRIDGSTETRERFEIAKRFNADPSIPVLLLTTRVGGLGLNLTGADTVIFLEHDWNPQADLQAMDRAHRLGQQRTVNVYRLVMKGTLEERILGLQAWKKRVAGTVVTQQNADGATGDILDLLADRTDETTAPKQKRAKVEGMSWMDKVAASADILDATDEYEQEFDLSSFITRMQH